MNAQTLSKIKLAYFLLLLQEYSIICISEVNYKQQLLNDIPADRCQYHFDPQTPRLAMICNHSINFEYKGIGVHLEQDRNGDPTDKTVVQSNLYRIKLTNNLIFEIENTYMTPDINDTNLETVRLHFLKQSLKNHPYSAGGDFNLNWKVNKAKLKFNIPTLQQNVNEPTRIAPYTNQTIGRVRTSKSTIDLILTNQPMTSRIENIAVVQTRDLRNDDAGLIFDHCGVVLESNFKIKDRYRDVLIPHDPYRRPDPTPEQNQLIHQEIQQIQCENDLDDYTQQLKLIFDKYIPQRLRTGFYKKRFYDLPMPDEILEAIRKKHKLQKQFKNNPTELNKQLRNKHRNLLTNMLRIHKKNYKDLILTRSAGFNSISSIQKKLEFLQAPGKKHQNQQQIVIDGHYGDNLAEHLATYFKERAEDLVDTVEILDSPDLNNVIKIDEIPENMLVLDHFPEITDIDKVIPANKTNKTASMDTISSFLIKQFWFSMKDKMNQIMTSGLEYPKIDQGYFQRTISKSSNKTPTCPKDMRPLGVLNPIPKYHCAKFVWTEIRNHISHIFLKRMIFTYYGGRLAIAAALDAALLQVFEGFFTCITKYDFSNAFGTIYEPRLNQIMRQLNLSEPILKFVTDFFQNQNYCRTIFTDPTTGFHSSTITGMAKGGPQGQCGTDVAFSIQQFGLSPIKDVGRGTYMDDFNDNMERCKTPKEAVTLAIENDVNLNKQAITVGFKKKRIKNNFYSDKYRPTGVFRRRH